MERLSKYSKVIVPDDASAIICEKTVVAFREITRSVVRPTLALDKTQTQEIEFLINPNLSSEVNPKECYLHVDLSVETSKGDPFPAGKQISCSQVKF